MRIAMLVPLTLVILPSAKWMVSLRPCEMSVTPMFRLSIARRLIPMCFLYASMLTFPCRSLSESRCMTPLRVLAHVTFMMLQYLSVVQLVRLVTMLPEIWSALGTARATCSLLYRVMGYVVVLEILHTY